MRAVYSRDDVMLLATRRRAILLRLEQVSEAGAGQGLDPNRVTRSKRTWAPPPGADIEGRDANTPPSIDVSMYAHFEWHFRRVRLTDGDRFGEGIVDPPKVHRLCAAAERAWDDYCTGGRSRRVASSPERDGHILRAYVGWREIDVAIVEGVSVAHVRKLRHEAGRDKVTGHWIAEAPRPAPAVGASLLTPVAA